MTAAAMRAPRLAARATAGWAPHEGSLVLALAAFAAPAAFAAGHWVAFVSPAPLGRAAVAVTIATALGAALVALGRAGLPRPLAHAAAAGMALAALALALTAMGLPVKLLAPGNWDELRAILDRGLAALPAIDWPYRGGDRWVRLVVTLGAPALVTVAAALAFWPARRAGPALRGLALLVLLAGYGLAITENDPGATLLHGFALLAVLAVWLWLPRLHALAAVPATVAVVVAGVAAVPLAGALDPAKPVIAYGAPSLFGGRSITFDWNHSYGPLNWSRNGTTLLEVKAARPFYWKAETLDRFDGLRWLRSTANNGTRATAELPLTRRPAWDESIRVTVRSLETSFVVGVGTPFAVSGAGDAVVGSADGTVRRLDEPLRKGESYTVSAYVPQPSVGQLRAAPASYEPWLTQYTQLDLPAPGTSNLRRRGVRAAAPSTLSVPLRSPDGAGGKAAAALSASPYARTYALAQRITAGAPTPYDAAKRVEQYLRNTYTYSERPPARAFPLEAFLFRDRIGYCQQFSGAMGLMMRMLGIPTRVVSGFYPGSFNRDTGEYRVRDLDAHSWVEVYFPRIGWVIFDPTPSAGTPGTGNRATPAGRTGGDAGAVRSAPNTAVGPSPRATDVAKAAPRRREGGRGASRPGAWVVGAALLAAAIAVAGALALAARPRRRDRHGGVDGATEELRRALERLGWDVAPGTTLLALERRLARGAGPASGRYVRRLREGRFGPAARRPPRRAQRRALRRELSAGRGLGGRLRGLLALPPRLAARERGRGGLLSPVKQRLISLLP